MDVISWMSYIMLAVAGIVFFLLQFISAPYGRYSSSSFGFLIPARIAWFIQEIPAFLVPMYVWWTNGSSVGVANTALFSLFLIHYFHRCLIYPFTISNSAKPSPVFVVLSAIGICAYNGYLQSAYLLQTAEYPNTWLYTSRFLLGAVMFFFGMAVNIHSDYTIRSLRKNNKSGGYVIPTGGMFEFVSCGNYFGEIVEWLGYAIACSSLPAISFFILTAANIGPRAFQHHKWYQEKFEDYPAHRKALIPFLF